jgi:ABC-type multidrug transport system fused ATPase/permease subunit
MLRLADCIDGEIAIDGIDTARISRQRLRSSIALIPQDATLFGGSIRLNLDPLQAHTDEEVWSALASVELTDAVTRAGGLTGQVADEGGNCQGSVLLRS